MARPSRQLPALSVVDYQMTSPRRTSESLRPDVFFFLFFADLALPHQCHIVRAPVLHIQSASTPAEMLFRQYSFKLNPDLCPRPHCKLKPVSVLPNHTDRAIRPRSRYLDRLRKSPFNVIVSADSHRGRRFAESNSSAPKGHLTPVEQIEQHCVDW